MKPARVLATVLAVVAACALASRAPAQPDSTAAQAATPKPAAATRPVAPAAAGTAIRKSVATPLHATPAATPRKPAPARPAGSPAGTCGTCHPRERVLFEQSRHAQEDVHCVSCHGGNDRSLEQSVAHGSGWIGRPARASVPKLCASCHADVERMRPYNLPVDQFALYQTSGHGRRLAQGDTRVAVCSDCHGAHDILPPTDPASRVFTLNIPKTCGRCHGDTTAVARAAAGPAPYRDYMSSVHAHELFDRGNHRAPTCVSCHGVHGAAPPGAGDIDKVCGQCHTAERRYFASGPHREAMIKAGLPECVSCHGNHAIQTAPPDRLATLCGSCHGDGSAQAKTGAGIWNEYRSAAAEIDRADALIARADAVPIQTEDYRARVEEARTYLREALPAAHSVHAEIAGGLTARARSMGGEVATEIKEKLGHLQARKVGLLVIWFYLVVTVLVLRRYQKQAARTD